MGVDRKEEIVATLDHRRQHGVDYGIVRCNEDVVPREPIEFNSEMHHQIVRCTQERVPETEPRRGDIRLEGFIRTDGQKTAGSLAFLDQPQRKAWGFLARNSPIKALLTVSRGNSG